MRAGEATGGVDRDDPGHSEDGMLVRRRSAGPGAARDTAQEAKTERVESIADDVVILNRGMVTREGSLGQLRNNHDTLRQFFPSLHD